MTTPDNIRDHFMLRYRQLVGIEHPDAVSNWPIARGCDVVRARYGNALFVHLKDTMNEGHSITTQLIQLSKIDTGVDRIDRGNRRAVLERLETQFRPGPRDAVLLIEDAFRSDTQLYIPDDILNEQFREVMGRHELVLGLVPSKIFLSHKTVDKAKVIAYYDALKFLGFDPWLDKEEMPAGTNPHRGIHKGFQDGCAVVFFITPSFKDEAFIAAEIEYAMAQKTKRGDKFAIITLVFKEGDQEGKVPELLKDRFIYVHPKNDAEGLHEILRALPLKVGPVRWRI